MSSIIAVIFFLPSVAASRSWAFESAIPQKTLNAVISSWSVAENSGAEPVDHLRAPDEPVAPSGWRRTGSTASDTPSTCRPPSFSAGRWRRPECLGSRRSRTRAGNARAQRDAGAVRRARVPRPGAAAHVVDEEERAAVRADAGPPIRHGLARESVRVQNGGSLLRSRKKRCLVLVVVKCLLDLVDVPLVRLRIRKHCLSNRFHDIKSK
jgi:hypothetical protein